MHGRRPLLYPQFRSKIPPVDTLETSTRLVLLINELRKPFLYLGAALGCTTLGFYFLSPTLLKIFQAHLNQQLAFFTVAEPFLAHVKLALALALFSLAPLIIFSFWRAMAKPFGLSVRSTAWLALSTSLLFYAGAGFCYFITLPFGVKFLLSFQSEQLRPVIAIGKFVSFTTVFILAFGLIFELPVFMVFAGKTGILPRKSFEENRRYAVLIISILAALLTPTPDIVNMMLMGVPLYLLYEAGILVLKLLRIA